MVGTAAPGAPHELLQDEAALGSTPVARSANAALRALSRASRAFSLYDPKNEIILRFLAEYREKLTAALEAHGALTFEVQPFALKLGADTVYEDADRERSLAFRLFRDGVRTLTLQPGLGWDECVRLLEVLSVRLSGVRQQEDDILTLLRKAQFDKLTFTAAEGFAPTEEHPEPPLEEEGAGGRLLVAAPPPDFDQPLPLQEAPVSFGWREVPERYLEALRAEDAPATVPAQAVRLVGDLLRAANGPASELSNGELVPFVTEVRDFCVAEGAFGALVALVRTVKHQHGIGSDLLRPVIAGIGAPAALAHLLDLIPSNATAAPPDLVALVLEVPGEHSGPVVQRLGETEDPQVQLVLKDLLRALARANPQTLLEQLHAATPEVAKLMVPMIMEVAPEQALTMAARLAETDEPRAHVEALGILSRAPRTDQLSALLSRFVLSSDEAVFCRCCEVMVATREQRGFDLLARQAEVRALDGALTRPMATALGEALAQLSPMPAQGLFKQWCQLKAGLLSRMSAHHRWLQMIAVAGLAVLNDAESDALIREAHKQARDEELKRQCVAAMMRRRKQGGPPGG
jgi:hypothetical protein